MQRFFRSAALLVFTCWGLLAACNKEATKSRKELLTQEKWIIRSYTDMPGYDFDGDGTNDTNVFSFYEACDKDDYTRFYENGSGENNEGNFKCDPADPQSDNFAWSFSNNEQSIVIDNTTADINELSNDRLVVTSKYNQGGVSHTEVITFTH
jgi:hypothetical protein